MSTMTTLDPSKHCFRFSNNDIKWTYGPFSGKALCGGMCYAVMDYFHHGMSIPIDEEAPPEGTTLQAYILDRQITAHVNTVPTFGLAYMTSTGTRVQESINLIPVLDYNLGMYGPAIMCLTGVKKGHHVIALGCKTGPSPEIQLYDPNFPTAIVSLTLESVTANFKRWKHSFSQETWYGFFLDTDYKKKVPPTLCGEPNWRWCNRCDGLFFNGDGNDKGRCPAGGGHTAGGVRNYVLPINAGNGEGDWKWCKLCQGLFWAGPGTSNKCPRGGSHDKFDKNVYFMPRNTGAGEGNWRWCTRCQGMFWAGKAVKGKCPAGGQHTQGGNSNYFLMAHNVAN